MTYQLFISYSQKDGDVAASLASKLEDSGLRCFLADKSILAAAQWEPALREAMIAADRVLLLLTPRSKESLWVAAEAGAAWILNKPLIPVLMFVHPNELFEPIRKYQARVVETPEQVNALVQELRRLSPVAKDSAKRSRAKREKAAGPRPAVESFTTADGWDKLLRVGEWTRDEKSGAIHGGGTYRYLLSEGIFKPPFRVRSRLTFLGPSPEPDYLDNVNAGIVFAWRVPERARQYYHLMFTGKRLLLEAIGSHTGDELDFHHLDEGVPFRLESKRPYDLVLRTGKNELSVWCDGHEVYALKLGEATPAGRVGLRPWRSRLVCEKFEIAPDSQSS